MVNSKIGLVTRNSKILSSNEEYRMMNNEVSKSEIK